MHDFYNEKEVTARKEHKCSEQGCKRTNVIRKGDRYFRISGKFDGDVWDAKLCLRCKRLRNKMGKHPRFRKDFYDEDGGCPIGSLLDWVRDYL